MAAMGEAAAVAVAAVAGVRRATATAPSLGDLCGPCWLYPAVEIRSVDVDVDVDVDVSKVGGSRE